MTTRLSHWLLPQLERLAKADPGRIEALLAAVRHANPELFCELALMAAEHGELTREEAASEIGCAGDLESLLETFREVMSEVSQTEIIETDPRGVARIAGKGVKVWEIVREYRRVDSVAAMRGAFPGLSEAELRAALVYAGRNPDEIGSQIRAYEEIVERSKAAYPFAK